MGIKIFYDCVMDLLDLDRYTTDLYALDGTQSSVYTLANLQKKSRHVFAEITPDALTNKGTIGVMLYHLESGNIFRGGSLAGTNFQSNGDLKWQVWADTTTSDAKAAYQDVALITTDYMDGSPGLSLATYGLEIFENVTQVIGVTDATQFTVGRYIRTGSPATFAKILAIESPTTLRIGVDDNNTGITTPGLSLYECYTPQHTTASYDSGVTDTLGSPYTALGSSTSFSFVGSPLMTYPQLVTELNSNLTGVTVSLASDYSYMRFQSNLTGSPSSYVKLGTGSPLDIIVGLDSGNGAVASRVVDAYTRATNIYTPLSQSRASTDWGETFWDTGGVSSSLASYANDNVYDFGSPHLTTAFGVYATFYCDTTTQELVKVGRFTQGKGFVPKYSFSKNYELTVVDTTKQVRTEGGSMKSIGGPWHRTARLPFSAVRETDKNILMDMMRTVGLRQDIAISMFPDDPSAERMHMGTFLGRLRRPIKMKEVQYGWYTTTLEVEETN
jgi:hypothetical protein